MSERHLSVYQLFDTLQKEYIVCELRHRIYPILKHKEYWKKVAGLKKDKIVDIAKRNCLLSIFDDKRIKDHYETLIYNKSGAPNFYYPDNVRKEQQHYWDVVNYYAAGSEVRVIEDGYPKVGIVEKIDVESLKVEVKLNEEIKSLGFDQVTRIL